MGYFATAGTSSGAVSGGGITGSSVTLPAGKLSFVGEFTDSFLPMGEVADTGINFSITFAPSANGTGFAGSFDGYPSWELTGPNGYYLPLGQGNPLSLLPGMPTNNIEGYIPGTCPLGVCR